MRAPAIALLWGIVLPACVESPRSTERAVDSALAAEAAGDYGEDEDPGEAGGSVEMEVRATVSGRTVSATGFGTCEHASEASIHGRPAALWTARWSGEPGIGFRHLNLAFWEPVGGAPEVNLALDIGSGTHELATVQGAPPKGSGTATREVGTSGGTLVVEGTDAGGRSLRVSVRCARFDQLVAEGG
jgi:hypothetical protein